MSGPTPPVCVLVNPYTLSCPDFVLPKGADFREDAVKACQIAEPEAVALLAKRWAEGNDRSKAAWDA